MYEYSLSLATGLDIPIPECQFTLHQPSIKEISMFGEQNFFSTLQLLCLNKTMYIEDPELLLQTSNFDIFITLLQDPKMAEFKENIKILMQIMIPQSQIIFTERSMLLNKEGTIFNIDEGNFESFQKVLRDIFCLDKTDENTYNPSSPAAKKIADKILKGRAKLAQEHAKTEGSGSMLGQYLSILTVGLNSMSYKDCCDLTMFQLYDLIERYTLYINWDIDIRSRLAGANGEKTVDNWMKKIH